MRKRIYTTQILALSTALTAGGFCSLPVLAQDNIQQTQAPVRMVRFYNRKTGEHFYTGNEAEQKQVQADGWEYEGTGWLAPAYSDSPVYRLCNPNTGDHHYTMDVGERDALVKLGWNDEGIGWYSDSGKQVPVYRQYNPNAAAGAHNFTISKEEEKYLEVYGWIPEGIAWYGIRNDSQTLDIAGTYSDITPAVNSAYDSLTIDDYMTIRGSHRASKAGITRVYSWSGELINLVPAGDLEYAATLSKVQRLEPNFSPAPGDVTVDEVLNFDFQEGDTLTIYMPGYPVSKLPQRYQDGLEKAGYPSDVLQRPCIANVNQNMMFFIEEQLAL